MFSRNPAFLGQVPIARLGITAEEYARELQRRRQQLEPPPAPSPRRYVSCVMSYEDRQAKERICQILDAIDKTPAENQREQALYAQEFRRQWDGLLQGQKDCMEGWLNENCPNLLTRFDAQMSTIRPAVPSVYRYAPTATEFAEQVTPPPPAPPEEGEPVPTFDLPRTPTSQLPPVTTGTTTTMAPLDTFEPVETPGITSFAATETAVQCPPGQVFDTGIGECVPEPVATGYGQQFPGGPGGIISAGLTLGPGAISAPTLGRYRVMNL